MICHFLKQENKHLFFIVAHKRTFHSKLYILTYKYERQFSQIKFSVLSRVMRSFLLCRLKLTQMFWTILSKNHARKFSFSSVEMVENYIGNQSFEVNLSVRFLLIKSLCFLVVFVPKICEKRLIIFFFYILDEDYQI